MSICQEQKPTLIPLWENGKQYSIPPLKKGVRGIFKGIWKKVNSTKIICCKNPKNLVRYTASGSGKSSDLISWRKLPK